MNLAILSRNYAQYETLIRQLIKSYAYENINIISATSEPAQLPFSSIEVLIANPNLANTIVHKLDKLVWLQSSWAGVNSLILNDKKNYHLTGLKGVFGHKMSEYVFAHILHRYRNIDFYQNSQQSQKWQEAQTRSLRGKCLGILGLGDIGHQVALSAKAFGMTVYSYNRSTSPSIADKCFVHEPKTSLNQGHNNCLLNFANSCDIVLNLLPQTSLSEGLCTADFFAAMPAGSMFINAGRGSVIKHDEDLVDALNRRHLGAAIIDVCKQEPLPKSHPFWRTSGLLLTNHSAATSEPSDVVQVFADNLRRYLNGQTLAYLVDLNKGY